VLSLPPPAQAGAGGIEGGSCSPTDTPPDTCYGQCEVGSFPMGAANSFVSGASITPTPIALNTPRAFYAATALQFDDQIPTTIMGQVCDAALSVFRFGLVTGGIIDAKGTVTKTAEIFGPMVVNPLCAEGFVPTEPAPLFVSGFVPTMSMGTARVMHQATLFSFAFSILPPSDSFLGGFSGQASVLITGGSSDLSVGDHSTTALASAEILTFSGSFPPSAFTCAGSPPPPPENFTSTTTVSMNVARTLHQATLLDPKSGLVLITGGLNDKRQALNTAEIFNPTGGLGGTPIFTFTKGKMIHPRFGHTATLIAGGKVLIAGGYSSGAGYPNFDGTSSSVERAAITATAEIYDPSSQTFSEAGKMFTARAGHTASLISTNSPQLMGSVLIAGGITNKGVTDSAELYTPGSGFTKVKNMHAPRFLHSAASIGTGEVLIAGGTSGPNLQTSLMTAERFDPTTSSFSLTTGSMNAVREGFSAGTDIPIQSSNMVVLPGGLNSSGTPQNSTDIYLP